MKGRMTIPQYRATDLLMFALILAVFETVIVRAAGWFPMEAWTVSCTAAVTAVVMVRWGPWGAIHAVLGGIVYCLAVGGKASQFVIYCAGNLGGLAGLAVVKQAGWEKLRKSFPMMMLYGVTVLLGMQAGRGLVSLAFGHSFAAALGFITTDAISYIFTLVILWITSRLDGILEEQHHYLARIQEEGRGES